MKNSNIDGIYFTFVRLNNITTPGVRQFQNDTRVLFDLNLVYRHLSLEYDLQYCKLFSFETRSVPVLLCISVSVSIITSFRRYDKFGINYLGTYWSRQCVAVGHR